MRNGPEVGHYYRVDGLVEVTTPKQNILSLTDGTVIKVIALDKKGFGPHIIELERRPGFHLEVSDYLAVCGKMKKMSALEVLSLAADD